MPKNSDADHTQPTVHLGAGELTIEEVVGVARFGWKVAEVGDEASPPDSKKAYARLLQSRAWVDKAVEENERRKASGESTKAYYGINTGFGSKVGRIGLDTEDIPWVSRNLIVSHSTGMGDFLEIEIVRAAMLIRANSLALGYSGVRPVVINTLVQMLNRGVVPAIPEYGSVGASGDLIPLSHLALVLSKRPETQKLPTSLPADYEAESGKAFVVLTGDPSEDTLSAEQITKFGEASYALLRGDEAMKFRNIERIELLAREGLGLNNGTAFSTAIGVLALCDAENLARHAEIGTALTLEALLGFRDAFLPQVQKVRRHSGQIETAQRILKFIQGSVLADGAANEDPRHVPPQDGYSIRVAPQVIGAVWDALKFIRQTLENEINAVTDNPLIFDLDDGHPFHLPRDYKAVSGGNFHGAPLAYAMDFLGIVITDLGSLSERRTFRLTDPNLNNGLPAMLVQEDKPGMTSGVMMAQYLAASLVSDCKTLAHPDSVDSIPTSANQEDHVSMSMNAARHARQIVKNIETVVAIELFSASLGLHLRINALQHLVDDPAFKPEDINTEERSRVDECVLYLREKGLAIETGGGSKVALDLIHQQLFQGNQGLPMIGPSATSEDRYLRPYVIRMLELLHGGTIVDQVYQACGITHPPL